MQSNVLVVALVALLGLLSLVGTASAACAVQPAGVCCLLACPTFAPCWLKKACPVVPPPNQPPPPPPPDPLPILQKVFDGIADIFKAVEALLPPGSPVLNILNNVFHDIANIFGDVEKTIAGRRKRASEKCGKDDDDEDSGSYGYGGKKNKGKLGYKSAKAANEAIKAAGELNEATGNEISKLSVEYKLKSSADRKKGYRKAVEKNAAEKAKVEKVLDAHAATLEESKEATEKFIVKVSPEAKEAGKKLIAIILDEKLSLEEKEAQVDELYGKMKPEWIKELKLKDISFIKRACGIASSPFATLGSIRVPLKLEL